MPRSVDTRLALAQALEAFAAFLRTEAELLTKAQAVRQPGPRDSVASRPQVDERMLYRVTEAAEILGLSRAKVYELLQRGDIESVQVGKSRRVSRGALAKFVSLLPGDREVEP